jgi:uncharacterized protein (TIGR03000 family)
MHRTRSPRPAVVGLLLALAGPLVAADSAPAQIQVKLPTADATLTIMDWKATSTGTERQLQTPPLARGQTFRYRVKASWTANGQPIAVERDVLVEAGQTVLVDFTGAVGEAKPAAKGAQSRTFLFTYGATVTGLKPGQKARLWLPVPPDSDEQTIYEATRKLPDGARAALDQEPKYGNWVLYVEADANAQGPVPVTLTYKVTRREVLGGLPTKEDKEAITRLFLGADAKVPVGGKALTLLEGKAVPEDPFQAAKVMYEVVNTHMKYSKEGTGWGNGDSDWACDSKFGNCSDFHSLFISLARAKHIPAKFEMGFPIPTKRGSGEVGGYHCWAMFQAANKGWVPVDISEANKNPSMKDYYFGNLTEDRVSFSVGRDITLVPKQDGPPLNFFIYPYAEVDGKPYTQVTRKFSYEDVAGR